MLQWETMNDVKGEHQTRICEALGYLSGLFYVTLFVS